MQKILVVYQRLIEKLESDSYPFHYSLLAFFFAATLRNFLEYVVAEESFARPLFEIFYHYYVSYICGAICLVTLFHLVTRERIEKVARVILPCFIILNIVPLADLAVFTCYYIISLYWSQSDSHIVFINITYGYSD